MGWVGVTSKSYESFILGNLRVQEVDADSPAAL